MRTTLADESHYVRLAQQRLHDREQTDPSPTPLARRFRYLGILSSLKNGVVGDSAWGRRMEGRKLVQRRWKPWMKARYDMTTFPFKLKPECK